MHVNVPTFRENIIPVTSDIGLKSKQKRNRINHCLPDMHNSLNILSKKEYAEEVRELSTVTTI